MIKTTQMSVYHPQTDVLVVHNNKMLKMQFVCLCIIIVKIDLYNGSHIMGEFAPGSGKAAMVL